jgi:hypothetical protein
MVPALSKGAVKSYVALVRTGIGAGSSELLGLLGFVGMLSDSLQSNPCVLVWIGGGI